MVMNMRFAPVVRSSGWRPASGRGCVEALGDAHSGPGARATQPSVEEPIRAAEVVGALSLATDLGTGQPLEHALRTAVIAIRLGELAGTSQQELVDTYYVALLHSSGCTSDGHEAAQLYLSGPAGAHDALSCCRCIVGQRSG